MKAKDVLRRYAAGERDFRRVNLRGQSFQGKYLSGADFSEADIRGTNFKNANLTETKFCKAKAGLQKRWVIILLLVSWIISGLSGFTSSLGGALVRSIFDSSVVTAQVFNLITLVAIIVLFAVIIRQGIGGGIAVAIAVAIAFAVTGVVAGAGTFAVAGFRELMVTGDGVGARPFEISIAVTVAIAIAIAIAVAGAGTFAVAIAVAGAIAIAVAIAVAGAIAIAVAMAIAVAIALAIAIGVSVPGIFLAVPVGVVVGSAFALLGTYLGWRALKGDPRDAWIRTIAIAFAATGGTSFYKADLTDADFTGAILKSTDLREATITRTCWRETIKLDRVRPGNTILSDPAVRELLISGNGYKKSYVDANLRSANLRGANLNKANLKLADLSEATLEDANLKWANLTEAQAVGTDFSHTYFTGACLEAWNIESSTKLEDVDCQFVYLLENPEPRTDNRERRPSSGEFQPGEFTKLFQEILNTVDLIFLNGVDWKAFSAAFKKVQVENEDTELAIQSIENKGDGVVVVKVSVPPDTNKEKIHSEFIQNYELALKAVEEKYKAELKAKDDQIVIYREQSANLWDIIKREANRPIQNIIDVTAKAENDMSDNSQSFTIDQSQATNPIVPIANDHARQEFNITNNLTSEQKQNLAEAAAEIQQLLNQLSQTNPTTTSKDKMIVVSEFVDKIENNPTLKAKVINALKAGGVEAFKETLDHPLVNILMATIEGWTEA
ncbi:MAG: pentapeptide repeat-containing protein [Moorea sp. SIO3G5]|nr:pentapeptide repeat-containing protein [Moorena sp. SIO3G5]